ncbi:MAG: response regulator transcription factor [Bacteroidetes bacterium]|nr:response regulator transcription factor [Bacteroidota bacterium]
MKKVLVVEDDRDITDLLEIHLKDLNCVLDKAYEGLAGLDFALKNPYDLIILDVMLPGLDGIEICRRIRAREVHTPILMLTAKAEEIDKVLGLEMGADDYLTKPFSVREFIARVKAIFRRMDLLGGRESGKSNGKILSFGALGIDLDKRKVTIKGERIELSPKEFELLSLLASNPGKAYDRNRILNLVWGYDFDGYEHTVNSHINRLRNKIEPDIHNPTYILTSWGVGYRFNEDL